MTTVVEAVVDVWFDIMVVYQKINGGAYTDTCVRGPVFTTQMHTDVR